MEKILVGEDPEYFLVETNSDGEEWGVPLPELFENRGYEILDVDEEYKHPVLFKGKNCNIIMDGIAAEVNVVPADNPKDLFSHIKEAKDRLEEIAQRENLQVSYKPTVKYDFSRWYNPESKLFSWCGIFGCDPDTDAIETNYTSPTVNVKTHKYRYGGGHVHISNGLDSSIAKYPMVAVRLLAIYVANYTIATSPYPELEKKRTFKYGQPGRYRIQQYKDGVTGLEYRTPSNVWSSTLEGTEGVFEQVRKVIEVIENREKTIEVIHEFLDLSIEAIKTANKILANEILSNLK